MTVKRIVANIATQNMPETVDFYRDLLDMEVAMDLGWVNTLTADAMAQTQLSIAREETNAPAIPDISIEVADVDAVHQRAQSLGLRIDYPLRDEPWGVRRFFVTDPAGKVLNILAHL